jgi:hypothetical protein
MRTSGLATEIFPGYVQPVEHAAANMLAAVLLSSLRDVTVEVRLGSPDPERVASSAAGLREMSTRMRTMAAQIKAGELAPSAAAPLNASPPYASIPVAEMEIALVEPIEWAGIDGRTVQAPHGGVRVPAPVAEEAISRGIGFPVNTPEGAAILQEARAHDVEPGMRNVRSTRVRRGPPWTRLAVNLYEWTQAERQRLAERAAA